MAKRANRKKQKFKLVVKTPYDSFVRRQSNDKQELETYALKLSLKKPYWKMFVCDSDFEI